jgi:carbonic anhydrase/acetyltransferase-like protein (isoleucine patch superfamily)
VFQRINSAIIAFMGCSPRPDPTVFIAPNVVIIGDVEIAADVSIWRGAVLRDDVCPIRIGRGSSVQDGVVMHGDEGSSLIVGCEVTIGHRAIVHSCSVEDEALIGMGAIALDKARIGRLALVGTGSLITSGKIVPERTVWMGTPARLVAALDDDTASNLPKGLTTIRRCPRSTCQRWREPRTCTSHLTYHGLIP